MLMNQIFKKSMPTEKVVHGYTIKKYPNGKYIETLNIISEIPTTFANELFPDENVQIEDALKKITDMNKEAVIEIVKKAIALIPEKALQIISTLTEIPYEDLHDKLSPKETLDILKAVWEVNDFASFFQDVQKITKGWMQKK